MFIKGILLDLDGTLYNYEKSHQFALEKSFYILNKEFGYPKDILEKHFNNAKKLIKSVLSNQAASHNRLLYFQILFELIDPKNISQAYRLNMFYWDNFIASIELYEGVIEFLRSEKRKICVVTDLTADIQFKKLLHLDLFKYIHSIVTSEEAGVEKPHPFIFQKALNKLEIKASEACIIGDNYKKDILGGLNAGIKPYWFCPDNNDFNKKINDNTMINFNHFKNLRIG